MPAGQDAVRGAYLFQLSLGKVADFHFFRRGRIAAVIHLHYGAIQPDASRIGWRVELCIVGLGQDNVGSGVPRNRRRDQIADQQSGD
jgi:hypothetical protein